MQTCLIKLQFHLQPSCGNAQLLECFGHGSKPKGFLAGSVSDSIFWKTHHVLYFFLFPIPYFSINSPLLAAHTTGRNQDWEYSNYMLLPLAPSPNWYYSLLSACSCHKSQNNYSDISIPGLWFPGSHHLQAKTNKHMSQSLLLYSYKSRILRRWMKQSIIQRLSHYAFGFILKEICYKQS